MSSYSEVLHINDDDYLWALKQTSTLHTYGRTDDEYHPVIHYSTRLACFDVIQLEI